MVLSNLPVLGRPTTIWMIVGQRPIALAVGAGVFFFVFFFFTFLLSSILSLLFSFSHSSLSLWETARYID